MTEERPRGEDEGSALEGGRERFEVLVEEALDDLPDTILDMLDNVAVVVADAPTPEQLREAGALDAGELLLGLYEGIPQVDRGGDYHMVLPDKITLFQRALEAVCPDEVVLRREVQVTVVHELAHHFGISDDRLEELGWA